MKSKKIISAALALTLAFGAVSFVPAQYAENIGIGITAEAASDFVIKTDSDGLNYVSSYTGAGGAITIPDSVNYIGNGAFKENSTITSVTFPESCSKVDKDAFSGCVNITNIVANGDMGFEENSFLNCINLKSVEIKGSINSGIYDRAFENCHLLETFEIVKNKKSFVIGCAAFASCYSLRSINISKCTKVYDSAFINCFNLKNITVPSGTKLIGDDYGEHQFGYYTPDNVTFDPNVDFALKLNQDTQYQKADGKTTTKAITLATSLETLFQFVDITNITNDIMLSYVMYYIGDNEIYLGAVEYTPSKLTMTVTKGSDAETYAKNNGIAYKYASTSSSSSSDKLAAPTNFKASKTTNSITLSWGAVEGADAYKVYMYNSETGKYEKYKNVKNAKCTVSGLESGTKYKFKVVALTKKSDGKYYNAGTVSKTASVTTK